jgi:ABC-2 type transport system permease protein
MNIFQLFAVYFRVGAMNELQYRANFFAQLFQSAIALVTGLVGLGLVFSHTNELAGWSRPELLAVMGVHILMGGVIQAFIQPNMQRVAEDVQQGTLDYVLTKPVDSQALISVRQIAIWQTVNVVIGLIIIGVAIYQLGTNVGLLQALAFVTALLLGSLMIYSFWLMLTAVAFWVVRVDQMINLFEGVYAAGRWPVGIYPGWLQGLLTFLMPVAFAVTVPAEALTNRLTLQTLGLAALLAVGLMLLARFIWFTGLRAYSGASS